MKSFTKFFADEYLVLEDIEYVDRTFFSKVLCEDVLAADPEVEKMEAILKDPSATDKYMGNLAENELMRIYKANPNSEEGLAARDKVMIEKVGLVKALVKRAIDSGIVPKEFAVDAYEEGIRAVYQVVEKYDPSKNDTFNAYATLYIKRYIQNAGNRMRKKDFLDRHPERFEFIDAPISGDGETDGASFGEHREDENAVVPGNDKKEEYALINSFIAKLPEKEATAVKLYYFNDETYEKIGKELNMSKVGARAVVTRALKKLRDFAEEHGITSAVALAD